MDSMDFYGFLWIFHGFLWVSMGFCGFSMGFYGFLWVSMDFATNFQVLHLEIRWESLISSGDFSWDGDQTPKDGDEMETWQSWLVDVGGLEHLDYPLVNCITILKFR